jgi:hypothetical protein
MTGAAAANGPHASGCTLACTLEWSRRGHCDCVAASTLQWRPPRGGNITANPPVCALPQASITAATDPRTITTSFTLKGSVRKIEALRVPLCDDRYIEFVPPEGRENVSRDDAVRDAVVAEALGFFLAVGGINGPRGQFVGGGASKN